MTTEEVNVKGSFCFFNQMNPIIAFVFQTISLQQPSFRLCTITGGFLPHFFSKLIIQLCWLFVVVLNSIHQKGTLLTPDFHFQLSYKKHKEKTTHAIFPIHACTFPRSGSSPWALHSAKSTFKGFKSAKVKFLSRLPRNMLLLPADVSCNAADFVIRKVFLKKLSQKLNELGVRGHIYFVSIFNFGLYIFFLITFYFFYNYPILFFYSALFLGY